MNKIIHTSNNNPNMIPTIYVPLIIPVKKIYVGINKQNIPQNALEINFWLSLNFR